MSKASSCDSTAKRCRKEQWARAYSEICEFEQTLAAEGMVLVKFWMHLSDGEQLRRFHSREHDPLRQWKLTDEDWRNRDNRKGYEKAIEEMLERTDHPDAPWTLVEGENKRWARVKVVESVVIDFPGKQVRPYADEKVRYRFRTGRALVEHLLHIGEVDWVNSLFLSCRFSAARIGQYNEFVYAFFKCLSEERIQYAEGWYDEHEKTTDAEDITIGDWQVQRRCPHLKADLTRFGILEGDTLTCQLHGWKFDLPSGRCLTGVGHQIRASKI